MTTELTDWMANYHGSYFKFKLPDEPNFIIGKVLDIDGKNSFSVSTEKYGMLRLIFNGKFILDFDFPPIGYFNSDNKVFHFSRLFPRQRTRGILANNVEIYDVLYKLIENKKRSIKLSFSNLQNCFESVFPSISEAKQKLERSQKAIALDRNIFITQPTSKSQNYSLFYHNETLVGYLDKGENKVIYAPPTGSFESIIIPWLEEKGENYSYVS